MDLIFLADEALTGSDAALAGGIFGALLALALGLLIVAFIIAVIIWIYISLAFTAIGRKTGHPHPALAWIPLVGPQLIAVRAAGMHWWPILLLIGTVIPWVGWLFALANAVFFIIWMWKTFEAVGKPGWWSIFQIIPILNIVYLVFVGIAAWGSGGSAPVAAVRRK